MEETRKNRKLQLKEVLENLSKDDLKSFIYQYARRDSTIEIALKAHFISRVTTTDEDSKYKKVLYEIIKPKTFSHPKIGATSKRTISIVITDFSLQMADMLSIENYKEAFYILKNSLDQIAYLQNKYHLKDKTIEAARKLFLDGLQTILEQDLAPAFRAKIEKELIEVVKTSYFIPKTNSVISVINDANVLTEKDKLAIINNLRKKEDESGSNNIPLTMMQLAHPFVPLAKDVLLDLNQNAVFDVLQTLIGQKKFDYVNFYLNNKDIHITTHQEILHCHYYLAKEDYKALSKALVKLDQKSVSIPMMRQLINQLTPEYLSKEFTKIKPWVDNLSFGFKSLIYANASHYEELIEMLIAQGELEWVKAYDLMLIEKGYEDQLQNIYLQVSINYLEIHIGKRAKEYMAKLDKRLNQINREVMLLDIKEILFSTFSHRSTFNIY